MQYPKFHLPIALFALVFVAEKGARADGIYYVWQSTISPSSIAVNQAANASLGFVGVSGEAKYFPYPWGNEHEVGATYLTGTYDNTTSTYKPITLTLKLIDTPSGSSDVLTFHGMFNWFPNTLPIIHFSDGDRTIPIGQDIYHVQMIDMGMTGLESYPDYDILAEIDASPAAGTPEPSTLLLAAIALPMLGFARWKKRVARMSKS